MAVDKKNMEYQSPSRDTEYGEPSFVFTDYDRGARSEAGQKDRDDDNQQREDDRPLN